MQDGALPVVSDPTCMEGVARMENLFKLKENRTTVRTEILAGLTTFMTMAYIIALNPNLLTNFDTGSPLWNGVVKSYPSVVLFAVDCVARCGVS